MAQGREGMRAADSDRQFVADRLREALNEGRLDLHEYDERLQQAYAAKTYGDLDVLLHDLPPVTPAERSGLATTAGTSGTPVEPAPRRSRRGIGPWMASMIGSWASVSVICVAIWLVSDRSGGFWPIWVMVPWGAVILGRGIKALTSGDPAGYAAWEQEREARKRELHDARHEERDKWRAERDRWRTERSRRRTERWDRRV